MFLSLATLIVCAAIAGAVPTTPTALSLKVKTSTSNLNVEGLENLKVTATITNAGSSGSRPSFNGARVHYSPTIAAGLDNPSVFTILAPGDYIDVTHDLSAAYDFTRSGAGNYSIEPSNRFTYVDADGTPKDLYATVEGIAEVKLSGDLAAFRHFHDKRATFNGCSTSEQADLEAAVTAAKTLLAGAISYIEGVSGDTERYKKWFGRYDDERKTFVQDVFQKISDNTDFSTLLYDCTCKEAGTIAYVSPGVSTRMHICPRFWDLPTTGSDSQAGTLIHEASHYRITGNTHDFRYGYGSCANLATTAPGDAIRNGDCYRYFAENVPRDD